MATEKNVPSLAEKLSALEAAFEARLPGKLSEIDGALSESLRLSSDKKSLQALHRLLHTMAGSAGTFGFVAMGSRARELESQINTLLSEADINDDCVMLFGRNVKAFLVWCEANPKGVRESKL